VSYSFKVSIICCNFSFSCEVFIFLVFLPENNATVSLKDAAELSPSLNSSLDDSNYAGLIMDPFKLKFAVYKDKLGKICCELTV